MGDRMVLAMKPQALVGYMNSNTKVMLVDVRDNDFGDGGFIKSAINIQSCMFIPPVITDLIQEAKAKDVSYIVIYCHFGQIRSVNVAKTVNKFLCQMDPVPLIQIAYVEGGFKAFLQSFSGTEFVVNT